MSDQTQMPNQRSLQERLTPEAIEAVCVALARWAVTVLRSINPKEANS
jgi:hypothetical protein